MKVSGEDLQGITFDEIQKDSAFMFKGLGDDCWQLTETMMDHTNSMKCPLNNMEHEKTLMLNDLSRVDDDSLVGSEEFAEHALKQSALNRQLLDLNKVLSQKEKDELLQQAKNAKHDPANKIAEQRTSGASRRRR